jgi:glycosyltransferase involved in cell wall biosynthesis
VRFGNSSASQDVAPGWLPMVTALVPCYNSAGFIAKTLECLAVQTWPNIEILIGDDCSSDRTVQVVRSFAKGRQNVRVLERSVNLGWLRNSNDLMKQGTGELMFFAFHDDLVSPDYVEKLVNALRRRPAAVLSYSDLELIELDGSRSEVRFDELTDLTSSFSRGLVMAKPSGGWWAPNRGIFRATAFERIGGIKPNDSGEYTADWTWLLHMALLGEFVRVPELLCQKFYKKGSLSKTWPHDAKQRADLRRAGRNVIRATELSQVQKALLITYLSLNSPLPPSLNRLIKRLIIAVARSASAVSRA